MNEQSLSDGSRRDGQFRKSGNPSVQRVVMALSGLMLLMLAVQPFFRFPLVGFWFLPLAAVYLFLLLVLPRLWLIVLPVATIIVDFTPWTGRFAYNEFDLLILVTLASGLFYQRYRYRVFAPSPAVLVLACYLSVIVLGYSQWLYFLVPPQAAWSNPYYSGELPFKVFKGTIWGIALVPMWGYLLAVDKRRTVNALVAGMSLAALCLGLVVLWERGTLGLFINGAAWYDSFSSVPGQQASYQVTALFSDMHTGGWVVEGVLSLLLPVTLYAITWGKVMPLRLLGATGLLALAYVSLVGSMGATFMAFVLGVVMYVLLIYRYRRISGLPTIIPFKWRASVLSLAAIAAILAYLLSGNNSQPSGGHEPDSARDHWEAVVESYQPGLWHQLVGNGVGTYPSRFIATHPEKIKVVGDFSITQDTNREALHLEGGSDLNFGQRVKIAPHTDYTLHLRYRSSQEGTLNVALCERNLLYANNFAPPCAYQSVSLEATDEGFQDAQVQFNSGRIGAGAGIGSWPTLLSLRYPDAGQLLEIDAVQLFADGFNLLRNGSFNGGLDHWFYYNDASQLPWHVENLLLQVWFETGWLGLALFLGLLYLLVRATIGRHEVDSLAPVYLTGVLTLCIFGLFGSPLDSARVSWIFWFFFASGLASLRIEKRSHIKSRLGTG